MILSLCILKTIFKFLVYKLIFEILCKMTLNASHLPGDSLLIGCITPCWLQPPLDPSPTPQSQSFCCLCEIHTGPAFFQFNYDLRRPFLVHGAQ